MVLLDVPAIFPVSDTASSTFPLVLLCSIAEYFYKLCRILMIFIMRDRSMRSGTELAREIQLTDWSTAGEQVKPVQPVLWSTNIA